MSYALQEVSIPVLTVQDGNDFTITDPVVVNDAWTEQNPAYMRFMNETNYDLYMTMRLSGDSFYLRSGDSYTLPLTPNERGFSYVCKYIYAQNPNPALILLTYYSNRETVYNLEDNNTHPPGIVKSGLSNGGTIEWGFPTSERAILVGTSGLNANQVRYTWLKVEYPITLVAHQFEVTTGPAANANVRIGVYLSDGNIQPAGGPLYDSGNIAVASAFVGVKTTTGISVSLSPGVYSIAINMDQSMSMRAIQTGAWDIDNAMGGTCIIQKVVNAQTFGAFPTPGTQWNATNTGNGGMQHSVVWRWTE